MSARAAVSGEITAQFSPRAAAGSDIGRAIFSGTALDAGTGLLAATIAFMEIGAVVCGVFVVRAVVR
jgi:hypothetical protein